VIFGDPLQPRGEEAFFRALLAECQKLVPERSESCDTVGLVLFESLAEDVDDAERRGDRLFLARGPDESGRSGAVLGRLAFEPLGFDAQPGSDSQENQPLASSPTRWSPSAAITASPREALASVLLFQEAAHREAAAGLAREVAASLTRARGGAAK
jgi:hypothetical protein